MSKITFLITNVRCTVQHDTNKTKDGNFVFGYPWCALIGCPALLATSLLAASTSSRGQDCCRYLLRSRTAPEGSTRQEHSKSERNLQVECLSFVLLLVVATAAVATVVNVVEQKERERDCISFRFFITFQHVSRVLDCLPPSHPYREVPTDDGGEEHVEYVEVAALVLVHTAGGGAADRGVG